jgi:hypothetical protein
LSSDEHEIILSGLTMNDSIPRRSGRHQRLRGVVFGEFTSCLTAGFYTCKF